MTTRQRIRRTALAVSMVAIATTATVMSGVGPAAAINSSVTHLTSAPHNETVGNAVTLNARVSSRMPTPTGTVEFFDGATDLGGAPVVNRLATLSLTLDPGSHTVTATYSGDVHTSPSTSAPWTIVVGDPSSTKTVLHYVSIPRMPVSSWTPTTHVVLVANVGIVAGQVNYGVRTGTATVEVDGTTDYIVNVARNLILLDLPDGLGSSGPHSFVATYHGDIHYNPSTSATRRITIP